MNINEFSNGIQGAQQGVLLGQFDRVDELNTRMQERHFSDQPLQPNFDPRSTPAKYARFPLIERRATATATIQSGTPYDIKTNFSPATRSGPVGAYLANIDTETVLQNRHVSLQKGADQGVYVPNSTSDLYKVAAYGRQEMQTHPSLFDRPSFTTTISPIVGQIGQDWVSNHTRTQLRGL